MNISITPSTIVSPTRIIPMFLVEPVIPAVSMAARMTVP